MPDISGLGKILVIIGMVIVAIGVFFILFNKIPWFGKLPGDIIVQKKNFTFYFPITTSIIISVIITLLLWIFLRR
ncbi:MAG: DUF2905 domain-containing protein [Nitrospirota bacterium]